MPIIEHLDHLRNVPSEVAVAPNYEEGKTVIDAKTVIDSKTVLPRDGKDLLYLGNSYERRWGSFASATGQFTSRGSDITTGAVTLGIDYRLTDHAVVGVALAYANTSFDLDAGGGVEINSLLSSLYATVYNKGFYLDGIFGLGYHHYDTERATSSGFAHGETDGGSIHALIGGGYEWYLGGFTVGPIASLRYTDVATDQFTEHGSLTPIRVTSGSRDSLESALGLKVAYTWKVDRVLVTPEIRAQWGHEYLDNRGEINRAEPFTPRQTSLGSDSFLLDAGAWVQFSPRLAIFAYYRGDIGRDHYTSHSVNGGVHIGF